MWSWKQSSTQVLRVIGLQLLCMSSRTSYNSALVRETLVTQPAKMLHPEDSNQGLIYLPSLNALGPMWTLTASPSVQGQKPLLSARGMSRAMSTSSKNAEISHSRPIASYPRILATSTRSERRMAALRGEDPLTASSQNPANLSSHSERKAFFKRMSRR